MLGHDRPDVICPRLAEVPCQGSSCPGRLDLGVCRHSARLHRWRELPVEIQQTSLRAGEAGFVPSSTPARGRLRAGLWCPCLGLGGAEAWQLSLVRAVSPDSVIWRGAAVLDGRGGSDPRMEDQLSARMPVGYGLDAARTLAAACDVIVSWAVTDVSSLLAGLDPRPGMVMVCHFPRESPWGEKTAELLGPVDRLVAVSELALESIPWPERASARVIWNAVDSDRLRVRRDRSSVRATWGIPGGAPVAGYLGRLSREKDPEAMVRLATALPEPWHVVLVGEGRERASLAIQARSINPGRILLVGGDPAVGDVLSAFDTLIVPSRFESFGLTLAEGLWAGLPVISTRSGLAKLEPGLVRTIPIGASGTVLAEAVLADRADASGTKSRVDRARAFARDRLGLDRFGRDWTACLEELCGGLRVIQPRKATETCPA
jgi:glycosyltransferase involved in cell wall biosynthesis